MPRGYLIDNQESTYFLTSTIVEWVDLFIRDEYKRLIVDNLNYCIENKGLVVNAYVLMTNHIHLVASAKEGNLSKIIGEFKKYTSNQLIQRILSSQESRRNWMEPVFRNAGMRNPKNEIFQIWQNGNHAEEIFSQKFAMQKIKYIHQNPVKAGIVNRAEDYIYSSASDYLGLKSPVKIKLISF